MVASELSYVGGGTDANRVMVEADAGVVTLKGMVRSWAEREEAERVAWQVPGVARVQNLVTISP